MAALLDCVISTTLETIDPSLVVVVTLAPVYLVNNGTKTPALSGTWAPIASQYIVGIQFEYGPSDLSVGITLSSSNKEALAWVRTDGVTPGKVYPTRYRAIGAAPNTYGPWTVPYNLTAGSDLVSGSFAGAGYLAYEDAIDFGGPYLVRIPALTQGDSLTEDPGMLDAGSWQYNQTALVAVADGKVSPSVMRSNVGYDASFFGARMVPADPNKTYQIEGWYRKSPAANGVVYGLVDLHTAAGAIIMGDGSYWLYNPSGESLPAANTWYYRSRVFGAGTSNPLPANAQTMRTGALLNYGGNAGYQEAQFVRIVEVTTIGGSLRRLNGSLATEPEVVTSQGIAYGILNQAATATNSDFSAVTGTGKPSDNAGTTLSLYAAVPAYLQINGNRVKKTGGPNAWDGGGTFWSRERFVGACVVSFQAETIDNAMFVGISADTPPNAGNYGAGSSYDGVDYGYYFSGGGYADIRIHGANAKVLGYSTDSLPSVVYDGQFVSWLMNGVLQHQLWVGAGKSFYLHGDMSTPGSIARNLKIEPYANNAVGGLKWEDPNEHYEISGNSVSKRSYAAGNWAYAAYSQGGFRNSCFLSGRFMPGGSVMIGLSDGKEQNVDGYVPLDYAWHGEAGTALYIYESGTYTGAAGVWDANTNLAIEYDGSLINYWKDGAVIRQVAVAFNRHFYAGVSSASPGKGVNNIAFTSSAQASRMGSNTRDAAGTARGQAEILTSEGVAYGLQGEGPWAREQGLTPGGVGLKISRLRANGRALNSYQTSNGVLTGALLSRMPLYVLGSSVVSSAARISISAFTLKGSGIVANYSAGTIDGLSFSQRYFVWLYDPDMAGGTITYVTTTDPDAYITDADYLFVDVITTVASDGGNGTPPPVPVPPGGGYDPDCIILDAWLPSMRQARDVQEGDGLLMLADDGVGFHPGQVTAVRDGYVPCYIVETVSGIRLTCSSTTPMPYWTGDNETPVGLKRVWECDGSEIVAVLDANGFRWEALASQPGLVGLMAVRHISADNGVFAAGDQRDRFIFTHNIKWKP